MCCLVFSQVVSSTSLKRDSSPEERYIIVYGVSKLYNCTRIQTNENYFPPSLHDIRPIIGPVNAALGGSELEVFCVHCKIGRAHV